MKIKVNPEFLSLDLLFIFPLKKSTGNYQGLICLSNNSVSRADRLINGQMGTVVKIHVNTVTKKPTLIYVKFDDDRPGRTLVQTSGNSFAIENDSVCIEPVLSKIKIKVHPGKPSSPEVAWACTVHKVQGLTLQNVVVTFN